MDDHATGPPESEMPAPEEEAGTHHTRNGDTPDDNGNADNKPGTALVWVPCTRPPAPQDIGSQLRRRREAAHRLPRLEHSGRRDPWSRSVR